MELRELKYFLAVAQEQSITKAAEYLYISQPSLSRQMQNLEQQLGTPLFERGSRKITLTEAGRLFKQRAEEIVALHDRMQQEFASADGIVSGDVRIGGGESFSLRTVAAAATDVQRTYPEVTFTFFSGDADSVLAKLDNGLIDFAIVVDMPLSDKYNFVQLPFCDTWGALLRKDNPLACEQHVTAEQLRTQPLILSRQAFVNDSPLCRWLGGFEGLTVKCRYNLIYNASLLVAAGMGCALTLENLVNTEGSQLCFRRLHPPLQARLHLVWKKYTILSKAAKVFLERTQKFAQDLSL